MKATSPPTVPGDSGAAPSQVLDASVDTRWAGLAPASDRGYRSSWDGGCVGPSSVTSVRNGWLGETDRCEAGGVATRFPRTTVQPPPRRRGGPGAQSGDVQVDAGAPAPRAGVSGRMRGPRRPAGVSGRPRCAGRVMGCRAGQCSCDTRCLSDIFGSSRLLHTFHAPLECL